MSILETIVDAQLSMRLRVFRANLNLHEGRLSVLQDFLKRLPLLEELSFQDHPPEIWPDIARLPSLRKLSLLIDTSEPWSSALLSSIRGPFPSLEYLTIASNQVDLRAVSNFLLLAKFDQVITLSIILPKYSHNSRNRLPGLDFPMLVDSISEKLSPPTLRNVSISVPEGIREPSGIWAHPTIRVESLRPLLKFCNMKTFTLVGRWSFELNEEFLMEVHSSWPLLEKFYLAPDWILS
ncbi:hypothetical protein NLI96_g173 [Meripilus lineatus]|uniref:Uncharacterized protein n=1 Tax=Meripilus lineatus TaxID=2056292 RepID=A0AAD5YP69_9APHY|nr:hypothetical protein NLI96_g173 [Physisporinus lineatus]